MWPHRHLVDPHRFVATGWDRTGSNPVRRITGDTRYETAAADGPSAIVTGEATFGDYRLNGMANSGAFLAKIIIGGEFFGVGGQLRRGVARINSNGTLDTAFANPQASQVNSVVTLGLGRFLAGGGFTSVGGVARAGVALING